VGADAAAIARSAPSARSIPKSTRGAERRVTTRELVRKLQHVARSAKVTGTDVGTDCAVHAYGEVRDWLREHPCVGYARSLVVVTAPGGAKVLVAVAAVEMPAAGQARRLRALMDRDGTGNVTELSRESGRYTRVRYDGAAYRSRIDDTVVVNAQAQVAVAGRSVPDLAAIVGAAIA
ncbi:MAG: hypothetical protein L0H84_17710, partial [Pseudonocardia sp.]|nr:hypothetical protein [Pseudonocardia sp.]